jgi:plastocyanin
MNTRNLRLSLITALACATTAALAQNPFAGTWKVDYSKSHVTGQTLSFAPEGDGQVRITEASNSYTFKPDGTDTKDSFGDTVQWKQMDDHNWKEFDKEGNMLITTTFTLSGDGKTMEVSSSGTRPNGQQIDEKETFARIAAGKNFFGKWKSTKMENNSPTTAQIDADGDNGIIWHIPEVKASVKLKFDGKDVTPTGPTIPAGLTLAATKTGPRSFELTEKENGKVILKAHYTVSADGNTMTRVGGAPGASAPTKLVYQKS